MTTDSSISRSPALDRLYDGSAAPRIAGAAPQVAVVGAGIAGLVASHLLTKAGCTVALFEASSRTGGRIRTDFGTQEAGLVCEHGGEFIDGAHRDMLALSRVFGLTLIDTEASSQAGLRTAYHFAGRHYDEAAITEAYASAAPRIAADAAALTPSVSRRSHGPFDILIDRLSIAEYLEGLDMEPWLRDLLGVAYETEYGLDIGELSAIGFVSMIGTDVADGFSIFGDSDERYKVREGVESITRSLAKGLGDRVRMEHRLVRVRGKASGYRLDFDVGGVATEHDADLVVLALPFTLLRHVDLGGLLGPTKQACIDQLGYGMNAKLIVGLRGRPWLDEGRDGGLYTDGPMQTGWDASRQRGGETGMYTWFMGGRPSIAMGHGDVDAHAARLSVATDAVFPGFDARRTGSATRVHWPTEPFAQGSYACYRPGQWTDLAGLEGQRAGGIHFAGEHCSRQFQGYMNGAAESARRVALRIVASCR